MTAYISIFPVLYAVFNYLYGKGQAGMKWLRIYNTVLIVIFSLISVINFNIFREWGTKLNAKAIGFAFTAPNESLASGASSPILPGLSILIFLITSGILLRKFIVPLHINFNKNKFSTRIIGSMVLMLINFLFIRGGSVAPINQSAAYYSDDSILNHAAVNTEWNLMYSVLAATGPHKNHYLYLTPKDADENLKALFSVKKDSTIQVLTTKRPNVVLVIMESFTADLTSVLGREKGVTPKFDSLVQHGILFSKIYSTGNRTDKGIIGTLAGFPSLAAGNMVNYLHKMQKIPAISQEFRRNGYQTSFYYGGASEFDNYKAFILSHSYQKLIDKKDFSKAEMNSKWGAYDGVVLNRQIKELNKTRQPFFATQMTLTNHEPFEVPGAYKFGLLDNSMRFRSTAYYTDSCINDFLNQAKKQAWYKNTLFVFIADHGHILPSESNEVYMPQRYHIPMLFFGDVIKKEYQGKVFDRVGSQIDLANTLLSQLSMNTKPFIWSKNLLNPYTRPFAFFSWDNGMGFINSQQCVTFDNVGKRVLYNDNKTAPKQTAESLRDGQSFLQKAYQQFIEL
ncbi:LTA synthase family protein [Pedobacter sp. MC2016-14]|uniref:LTA synthase family protein n=1 Tax=Pedobacter sp. MC2016-14 TaxID=2897327 RepID=UPI001E457DD4|nr:LTA synthase family protein [Pedobacter sp. MC2016-14]MCD0490195.1 LTA synthase family protein [Pedobacter sp. MC2016-14]